MDVKDRDHDGYVDKDLLVNLMAVPDPKNVGGLGAFFTFPFQTIEDVELIDSHTIAVMNDNNFPGTGGRSATQPDQNEYIEISLDQPLEIDHRLLPTSDRQPPGPRPDPWTMQSGEHGIRQDAADAALAAECCLQGRWQLARAAGAESPEARDLGCRTSRIRCSGASGRRGPSWSIPGPQ